MKIGMLPIRMKFLRLKHLPLVNYSSAPYLFMFNHEYFSEYLESQPEDNFIIVEDGNDGDADGIYIRQKTLFNNKPWVTTLCYR